MCQKNLVLDIFSIKILELPLPCGGVFVHSGQLGVISDSQVTKTNAAGEGGLSQGVLLASY
jgi:hypothetical protein